jgi:SAM-dependent methyltransferase
MTPILPVLLLIVGQSGYAGSPIPCVEAALEVAGVSSSSIVVDIGSGDGRVCVIAAKVYGCKAIGIELDGNLAALSRKTIERNRVSHLVEIRHEDALKSDLSTASVVFLYHQSDFLKALRPQIERLKPGTVVACLDYPLPWTDSKPIRTLTVDGHQHSIYAWRCGVEDSPLVQAAMLYPGVRFHEGLRDAYLVGLAEWNSKQQATYGRQDHYEFQRRYDDVRKTLGMRAVEVAAESWSWQSNEPMNVIAKGMFESWAQSRGPQPLADHWGVVSKPHARYGDGLARSRRGIWYATIIVADPD